MRPSDFILRSFAHHTAFKITLRERAFERSGSIDVYIGTVHVWFREGEREPDKQTDKQTGRHKPNRKTSVCWLWWHTIHFYLFPCTAYFDLCMTSIPTNRIHCFAPIYACNYLICSVHWLNDKQKAQDLRGEKNTIRIHYAIQLRFVIALNVCLSVSLACELALIALCEHCALSRLWIEYTV